MQEDTPTMLKDHPLAALKFHAARGFKVPPLSKYNAFRADWIAAIVKNPRAATWEQIKYFRAELKLIEANLRCLA
jgi:hypothetical protein